MKIKSKKIVPTVALVIFSVTGAILFFNHLSKNHASGQNNAASISS